MSETECLDPDKVPGEVSCLGWCGKKFMSPDKKRVRFCSRCRGRRDQASATASRMELMSMGGGVVDRKIQEACKD